MMTLFTRAALFPTLVGTLVGALAVAAPAPVAAQTPDSGFASLRGYVTRNREVPLDAVRRAVLSNRVVLLGDVHPAAEPKRLLLALLADPAVSARLDAVALEIPSTAQRWIGAYLRSDPEDSSLLFRDPGTLRSVWGGSGEWIAIFHRLWLLQRTRGRPLDVLAMDLAGWPARANSARAAVSMYADRDSAMAAAILDELERCGGCAARGGARVLAFLGGYHVLRGLEADLAIGHNNGRVIWLATRLERKGVHPFTILTDGLPRVVELSGERVRGATRVFDVLSRRGWPAPPYAVDTDAAAFDLVAHAIREPNDSTDIRFTLRPAAYLLRRSVDLFIYWGPTTPLGENAAPHAPGR